MLIAVELNHGDSNTIEKSKFVIEKVEGSNEESNLAKIQHLKLASSILKKN